MSEVRSKFVAAMVAGMVVTGFAADYKWSGGASGEWTTSSNWTPSGYPNGADDTAEFELAAAGQAVTVSSAVTVKGIRISGTKPLDLSGSAIALGAAGIHSTSTYTGAVVTVANALAISEANTVISNTVAAVHLKGTVSGAGGILKGGAGRLHLHCANTFAGGLRSTGTKLSPLGATLNLSGSFVGEVYKFNADTRDSSGVVIYNVDAFGTGKVEFDPEYTGDDGAGARLTVMNCSGSITNDIRISNDKQTVPSSKTYYGLEICGGDVTFTGKLSGYRFIVRMLTPNVVRFTKPISHGNYLVFRPECTGAEMYSDAALSGSCEFASAKGNIVYLNAPSSSAVNLFLSGARVVMLGENYLPPKLDYEFYWQHVNSVIDLNGFDQRVTSWVVKAKAKASPGTIHSATPAQIAFTVSTANELNCKWSGAAGFVWNPSSAITLSISNAVSQTRGAIGVSNGTVRVMRNAAFTDLSGLAVANGATFKIEADAGTIHKTDRITAENGAVIDIASGKTLTVGNMTVGGVPVAEGTTITKANKPEGLVFDGDGSIYVTGAGTPVYWKGTANARWNDGGNWSSGSVPGLDCDAYVTNSTTILLDSAMPKVHALYLGDGKNNSTLLVTNLNSTIEAGNIVVANKAKIVCGGAFTNETDMSRIHIVCGRLQVDEGGKIDASESGWSGGIWELKHDDVAKHAIQKDGFGPGVTANAGCYGAAHGGRGGCRSILATTISGTYGDALHPVTAGSGGSLPIGYGGKTVGNFIYASAGGGVIRIEATGAVTVNGSILADALNCGDSRDTGGAGGSIWITCASVQGGGKISAEGAAGGDLRQPILAYQGVSNNATDTDNKYGMPGGGGRIAIDYDPAAQAAADVTGLYVSAAGGEANSKYMSMYERDFWELASENGTLAFTDQTLVKQLFGKGLSGRVVGLKTLSFDGDLNFSRGFVSTMEEGFTLTVGGDLVITGAQSRLEVGGVCLTNLASRAGVWAGGELNRLTVGGDFAVSNKASFLIRAAQTNSLMRWGGEVQVAGSMTVGSNGYVYAASDGVNLGAPHFTVAGDVTVAPGGVISADRRGGFGADMTWAAQTYLGVIRSQGYGAGGGKASASASHGGLGKIAQQGTSTVVPPGSSEVAAVYDDPWLPTMPGSGGGSYGYGEGGTGGGVVFIAAGGDMTIDGRVSADGATTTYYSDKAMDAMGAGSGGTVFLCARTVAAGASAVVSAKGGEGMQGRTPGYQPTGGGGCIAIWEGSEYFISGEYSKRRHNIQPAAFLGTCDASGGDFLYTRYYPCAAVTQEMSALIKGENGTVRFGTFGPMHGLRVILR